MIIAMPRSTAHRPAGEEVPISWRGRRTKAFVPALLSARELELTSATVARAATAAAEVNHAAAQLGGDYEALGRLLLRAEGVASSSIEGVRAPVLDVVLAEQRPVGGPAAAAWVAANLAAVTEAVRGAQGGRLSVEQLCDWHRMLMTGNPTPGRYVGRLREEQGWIGGTSPLDAHLVTPPADRLGPLLADLVAYADRDDLDPIAQAAVAHAQFEVIHPFADGNGRVGRVLVAWLLTRRLSLVTPPPVSVRIAADVGGYAAGLTLFRLSQPDPWVRWFADAVSGAGEAQQALVAHVESLRSQWLARLSDRREARALRSDAIAWRVLELLPRHLVLTSDVLERELGVTSKAATAALAQLVAAGVLLEHGTLEPRGRGRPPKLYVSEELLALGGSSPLR